jgi:class 3 adenylate cyclase
MNLRMSDSKKFSILYVDDEPQNLISFRATFRREYDILTAQGGKEGIEILKTRPVNLIITDQRMPEMTGVQFLQRTLPDYPDAIRMVLTGFSDMDAIIEVINSGQIFRYITKPWDENELRMTIENARQLFDLQQNNKSLVKELQTRVEEQERVLKLFMKYVPEHVVEKALSDSPESIFEGELKNVTVLFCDIRGFTRISEEVDPKTIVRFLNDYYALMAEIIKRHEGTVNQFIGDEIFAAFGTPIASPYNERNAVLCGLEMLERLKELNLAYADTFSAPIEIGIGINSGEVVAGNLGSEDKISYSVTGDTVNTAKRIETLTREKPNSVLISASVYEKVGGQVKAIAWEPIEVRGKREKIQAYEVAGRIA